MRNVLCGLVTAGLTAAAAIGAPRESVTFNVVNSNGFQGNVNNITLTNTFNGSDGGGAYSATYLTVSGILGNRQGATFAKEACILVTPPGGTPFVVQPFNSDGWTGTVNTPPGTYAIPFGAFTTAGIWSFEFIEQFDDVTTPAAPGTQGTDCTWQTITFTLEDGTPPSAALPTTLASSQNQSWTLVDSDGLAAAPGSTRTATFTAGAPVNAFIISGVCTGRNGFLASNTNTTLMQTQVRVTPPGGTPITVGLFSVANFSTDSGSIAVNLPAPIDPGAGLWTVDFFETVDTTGVVDNIWNNVTLTVGNAVPPAATAISIPGDSSFGTATATFAAGETKWFSFVLAAPLSQAAGDWLDLDTETSAIADTAMGMYDSTGLRVATDFDDGSGTLSQLTFGFGLRAAVGNGLTYNGRDGANLAAGTYYVAVAAGNAGVVYHPGAFAVGNTNTNTGDATLRIRRGNSGTTTPPASTALTIPGDGSFGTQATTIAAGETKWFSFTLASTMNGFNGDFLDIDTETSAITDTAIALYNGTGGLVTSDLDDGSGTLSQLSFGIGSRPATGTSVAYDGRDGRVLPAGTYYVAVTAGNTGVTFVNGFWYVANFNTNVGGNAVVRIRQGVSALPTPPTATDLGVIAGPNDTSVTVDMTGTQIQWYKFILNNEVSVSALTWLDIDTEGTTGITDSELGLYARAGFLIATDDDDGSGNLSQLSFGQTTPVRVYTGTVGGNGRDGALLPPGTYYLAVGIFNVTFGAANFTVTSTATATGNMHVNFHTNLPSGPVACNAADVAGLGGSIGPDHFLTPDDIIVFLDAFFSGNLAVADIAVLGGNPGHDGMITPDDLIYFLDQFFRPCNP